MSHQFTSPHNIACLRKFIDAVQATAINVGSDAVRSALARCIASVQSPTSFVELLLPDTEVFEHICAENEKDAAHLTGRVEK